MTQDLRSHPQAIARLADRRSSLPAPATCSVSTVSGRIVAGELAPKPAASMHSSSRMTAVGDQHPFVRADSAADEPAHRVTVAVSPPGIH